MQRQIKKTRNHPSKYGTEKQKHRHQRCRQPKKNCAYFHSYRSSCPSPFCRKKCPASKKRQDRYAASRCLVIYLRKNTTNSIKCQPNNPANVVSLPTFQESEIFRIFPVLHFPFADKYATIRSLYESPITLEFWSCNYGYQGNQIRLFEPFP